MTRSRLVSYALLLSVFVVSSLLLWACGRFGLATFYLARFAACCFAVVAVVALITWRISRESKVQGDVISIGAAIVVATMSFLGPLHLYTAGVVSAIYATISRDELQRLPAELGATPGVPSRRLSSDEIPPNLRPFGRSRQIAVLLLGNKCSEGPCVAIAWRDVKFSFEIAFGRNGEDGRHILLERRLSDDTRLLLVSEH